MPRKILSTGARLFLLATAAWPAAAQPVAPDAIFHSGKVLTVDAQFSVREAIAVKDGRVVAVGSNDEVRRLAGAATAQHDLGGRTVMPGLIDSHVHAPAAAMFEFDHEIPPMETIAEAIELFE